ncbi:MAG: hypothetical protein HY328_06270 [Chloroflexi bacterium]|nr:hypothetical protein [Chloroflexota bacterium]
MAQPGQIYRKAHLTGQLRQGEIVSNLVQIKVAVDTIGSGETAIFQIIHPFAIVVSQDCDLEWDWNARRSGEDEYAAKAMSSLLFCEMVLAVDARQTPGMNSRAWDLIKTNRDIRYQFLQKSEPEYDLQGDGLPELIIDFKRYFAIPIEEVYARIRNGEIQRRCCFNSPYLQDIATRFYYYQYRVALPEPHFSEPAA